RGPTQCVLSRGLQPRDLRHHGDRAADPARRPVRTEGVMERVADPLAKVAGPAQTRSETIAFLAMVAIFVVAPFIAYPVFLMKALCFALFACAFNLLIGYGGLLSFGHALFFGWASYVAAHL